MTPRGTLHIIDERCRFKSDDDVVTIYTANALRDAPKVSLTRGGMILVALLSGGDYDQVRGFFLISSYLTAG